MNYPMLPVRSMKRQMVDVFRGYNHTLRIGDGEFYDMKNMTSDDYPVLSPRGRRGVYARPASPQGLIAKKELCYVDGTAFVIGEERHEMNLSTLEEDCPKVLTSMGAYVIIMPDKKYINTIDPEDRGEIEESFTTAGSTTLTLTTADGDEYQGQTVSDTAPANPENGDLWLDTSEKNHVLKRYTESTAQWVNILTTYIKVSNPGIGAAFSKGDGVSLSWDREEKTAVIQGIGSDYLIIIGIIDQTETIADSFTVTRQMPNMDFLTESGNRLWGCRYGQDVNGNHVNEIYASKLGDFKNWNVFQGNSMDSYAASCGTDGPFTGAVTHMGYPLFWKENCVHKVFGSYPAAYQIQTTTCRGVEQGSHASLAIVSEALYYKSRSGVCVYDGSLPVEMSYALGNEHYKNAVGGAHGSKYYISMENLKGAWNLFVYDTAKGMWHREDDLQASFLCSWLGEMYCVDARNRNIITLLGSWEPGEEEVEWMVETGELGLGSPDMKYLAGVNIRMLLDMGSQADIYAQYELTGEWVHLAKIFGTRLRSFSVPIRPRRSDHMKLKIEGKGGGKIYAITKTIGEGSDRAR